MLVSLIVIFLLQCKWVIAIVVNYNTTYILDYVKSLNYPIELHSIQTKDGYVLDVHRIPHGRNNNSGKGVTLLAHGLQESAEHWMINGNRSLAFLLADLGYDVWMTNARGCHHSKKHVFYDTGRWEYWDFSWHEIGIYDLPATLDYILMKTGVQNLSYIGHSQGATSFFVLTSLKPEYNDKINVMIALAPAAYMTHVKNPVYRTLSRVWELINPKMGMLDNPLINAVLENLCKNGIFVHNICSNVLFLMAGYDYEQLDKNLVPVIMRTLPAGSSTKQFIHYFQSIKSGYFRQYDYFTFENLRRYKTANPPDYNLSKISTKVALYYAQNDWLAVLEDVRKLRDQLPNVIVDRLIEYESFNHWDFLFAKDVVPLLYDHVLETLNKYN